jgi:hypothetical protein
MIVLDIVGILGVCVIIYFSYKVGKWVEAYKH